MKHRIPPWFARGALWAWLLTAMLVVTRVEAQSTGGSAGGSAWGGSSGSSSSGSSSSSSGSSSWGGSSGSSSGGGGGGNYGGPLKEHRALVLWILFDIPLCLIASVSFALYLAALDGTTGRPRPRFAPSSSQMPWVAVAFPLALLVTSVGAFATPDVYLFGTPRPPVLTPGREVEVWVGDRWCVGHVVGLNNDGTVRVTARTWTHLDEPMVVPARAVKTAFGDQWLDVGDWRPAHVTVLFDALCAVAFTALARKQRRLRALEVNGARVATISLAFDPTARAAVQQRMAEIARRAQSPSAESLLSMLREALVEAAAQRDALRATAATAVEPRAATSAQRDFETRATKERGRYLVERVRVDAGGARGVATTSTARAEEGGGFVVVTLVLAWSGDALRTAVTSRDDLVALAEQSRSAQITVRALELIWVPADPGDVMSSAEMEAVYPELAWIDADARSRFGRVTCGACRTAYARELGRCPSCGAPPSA